VSFGIICYNIKVKHNYTYNFYPSQNNYNGNQNFIKIIVHNLYAL